MADKYAKICLNGHVSIESTPISGEQFCEKCGAKMISKCPSCDAPIKEWSYNGVVVIGTPKFEKPLYCRSCGNPYPWTESALEAISLMIQEDEELSELEQEKLQESLPDIITETPKTNLASVRIKKALLSAGSFTAEAIRQFVIDFGCELAIRSLGLDQSK